MYDTTLMEFLIFSLFTLIACIPFWIYIAISKNEGSLWVGSAGAFFIALFRKVFRISEEDGKS